ncbi:class B sortase [Faecalibaculum rodentium]|jgi:sortase B|uniref:class B sortase n=1 Tax=Faecalibaculum rodentium TaxID=1702221 RepID=UPI0009F918BB|nr:class B sortase [Faecalibaculum rodentium]
MQCSERRKRTADHSSTGIHRLAKAADIGNRILSVLTIMVMTVGCLYCFYCLFDDWRQSQAGLPSTLQKFKPDAEDPLSFDELLKLNPDVIGWLTIDKTRIDQPVVQGKDDMEYINKGADGKPSLSGAIFLSELNKPDFSDPYNILYGHHMDNGGMFGDVMEFLDKKYFEEHKTGSLLTKEFTEYKLEVFAVMETDAMDPDVYSMALVSGGDTNAQIDMLRSKARYFREPGENSPKVFALSTCNSSQTDGRTILYAWVTKVVEHEK